ncbi:MAG: hypothetical protein R3D31_09495 [Hyphomicrobiaceae bacterium]
MVRGILLSCLLVGLSLLLVDARPAAAQPTAATYRVARVASDDRLNVRASPFAGARRLGAIPYNGRGVVRVGPQRRGWLLVRYGRLQGWVNGAYLERERFLAQPSLALPDWFSRMTRSWSQAFAPPPPPPVWRSRPARVVTPRRARVVTYRVVGVKPGHALKVQSDPRPTSSVIGVLRSGARGVRAAGVCHAQWCPVVYRGRRGWVWRAHVGRDG